MKMFQIIYHKLKYILIIYLYILITYIKGSYVIINQSLSQCDPANLTKLILQNTITNLSQSVINEFVQYSSKFIDEIDNDISNVIANVKFSRKILRNSTLTNKKDKNKNKINAFPKMKLNIGYEVEIQTVVDLYTDNIFNLLNYFSQNFGLLRENHAELESGLRRINTTLTSIEQTKCDAPITITEDSNATMETSHKGLPMNCYESYKRGNRKDGVTFIQPDLDLPSQEVWCNNSFEGGGWTVILRRAPQKFQLDFRRTFSEYEDGFGNSEAEYWVGLKSLHYLTSFTQNELYVQLEIPDENAFARYNNFRVDGPIGYNLYVSDYNESSSGGNSLIYHNKMPFSTYDKDRDLDPDRSCSALAGGGGFWFNFCYHTNPTGIYPPEGLPKDTAIHSMVEWRRWKGFHTFLTHFTMMIRPARRNS